MEQNLKLFDMVRIDHFRGFESYYSIPSEDKTAENGKWEQGPGIDLFQSLKVDKEKIIAEDLGFITPPVKKLLSDTGYKGIKVLQFGFDSRDLGDSGVHLPHNYPTNCVAYTGTHDNQTLKSWLDTISEKDMENVRNYLWDYYTPKEKLVIPLIASVLKSNAELSVIPLQDYMELSDDARINTPSTSYGNWNFRLSFDDLGEDLCDIIRKMTKIYNRV